MGTARTGAAVGWIRGRLGGGVDADDVDGGEGAGECDASAPDAHEKLVVFAHHVSVMDALHTALAQRAAAGTAVDIQDMWFRFTMDSIGELGFGVQMQSPFIARGERHGLSFVAEVAATDATQRSFVVRLQLQRGDASLFREMADRILSGLQLRHGP